MPMLMEHLLTPELISFGFARAAGGQQTEIQILRLMAEGWVPSGRFWTVMLLLAFLHR